MIRINLLPYRAKAKAEDIRRQAGVFLLIVIVIMVGMVYANIRLKNEIEQLNDKVAEINTNITRVEKAAKEVDAIRKKLKTLSQKIKTIKDLESQRKEAVRLLDNMTKMVAEKMPSSTSDELEGKESKPTKRLWFTSFQADGDAITILGIALDNRTVADFMTRLETSNLYTNVNLRRLRKQKIKKMNLKSFEIACKKAPKNKDEKDKK